MTADPKARKRKRLSRAAVYAALDVWHRGSAWRDYFHHGKSLHLMRRAINAALDAQEARRAR